MTGSTVLSSACTDLLCEPACEERDEILNSPCTDLLCEPACEERDEILGVKLEEAFVLRPHHADVKLLLCQLRQVLRVDGFSLKVVVL